MKKQEFINELKKRLKYVEENDDSVNNIFGWQSPEGGNDLKRFRVDVAMIRDGVVYRDTIFFWVQDEGRLVEKVLDVRWQGSYFRIDKEVEGIIVGQGIYSKNERVERKRDREKILGG